MPATPMDPQRWRRLRQLLDEALDLDEGEHDRYLADLCAADLPLRDDLRRLLLEHANNGRQRWIPPIERLAPQLVDAGEATGAAEAARVGECIGPFRLLRLIGVGGMGAVYLAERSVDNLVHRVALKIVRGDGASPAARERFERERQILANLAHPHIGTLFEGGQTADGQPYYTMEFVDGIAIGDYCREHELDLAQRLGLLIDVAGALAHAHHSLIVHRDIKPSNILVTADGRAKLLDFGIAKLIGANGDAATRAAFGPMTPEYAAPEQFRNAPITVATDVYQFGVLCFRLLTGALPYRADSGDGLAWAQAVSDQEPMPLSRALEATGTHGTWSDATAVARLKRRLGGDLDAIVRKTLAKAPGDRYASMDALITDLRAFLDGRPVSARRAGLVYFARRFVTRRPWTTAAAAATAAALLAATAFSVQAARRAERQAHRSEVANRFLLTTLDLTDRFSGNNRGDFTLAEVIERAVEQAHVELRDEPEVRADVLLQLSRALQNRGRLDGALKAAREAHALRSDSGVAPRDAAAANQQLASVEIESAHLDEAAGHLARTIDLLARVGNPPRALIQAYTSQGKLASMRGDAAASLDWYQRVLPLRRALDGDHDVDLAMDYGNLGTGLYNLSRFREADEAFAHGIALLRARLGSAHPRIGFLQFGQASALIQLGRFDEARALLDQADGTLGGPDGGGNPGSVNTGRSRALLDYYASDYTGALRRADQALQQTRSASPVSVASNLIFRGRIQLADGAVADALASFSDAERLFAENGRAAHAQRWYARGLGGVARSAMGEVSRGDADLDEALAQLERAHPGFELADLALYGGAAARRRGDAATALARHRRAGQLQRETGWLGKLGAAYVDAELAADGWGSGADAEARDAAPARQASAVAVMQRIGPHDPRLRSLLSVRGAGPAG